MKFSFLAVYSGGPVDFSSEITLEDIKNILEEFPELDISETEESEYEYLFNENDNDELACELAAKEYFKVEELPEDYDEWKDFLWYERNDVWKEFDKEAIAEFMTDENGYSRDAQFFYLMKDIQVSGIVDRDTLYKLFDSGLVDRATDTQTMGTLGGPGNLMGWMPDIDCELDSSHVISSIRITPLPDRGECDERNWNRIKEAFVNIFGTNKRYYLHEYFRNSINYVSGECV